MVGMVRENEQGGDAPSTPPDEEERHPPVLHLRFIRSDASSLPERRLVGLRRIHDRGVRETGDACMDIR